MKKHKILTFASLAIILLLTATGCTTTPTGSSVEQEPIKIGLVFPITGAASYIGEQSLSGFRLAQEELKHKTIAGRPIELIVEDSQTSTEESVTAATKLIHMDQAKIMLSTLTGPSEAIAPIAEQSQTILIYHSTTEQTAQDKEYVFLTFPTAKSFCKEATQAALDQGKRRFAFMTDLIGGGVECEQGIMEAISKYPDAELVITEKFELQSPDFRTIILKIKAKDPDGLIIYTYGHMFPMIYQQMIELDAKIPLVCPFTTSTCTGSLKAIEIAESADLLKGALGSDFYFGPESDDPEVQSFVSKYKEKYDTLPTGFSAHAYEDLKMLVEILKKCGGDKDTECVKKELYSVKHTGITGTVEFDEQGVAVMPVRTLEYIESSWKDIH